MASATFTASGFGFAQEFTPRAHLTRRGRVLRAFIVVLVVGISLISVRPIVASMSRESVRAVDMAARVPTVEVVVAPGDSLWSIAGRVAPGADPREVVEVLRRLNGLRGNMILVGQTLTVPRNTQAVLPNA